MIFILSFAHRYNSTLSTSYAIIFGLKKNKNPNYSGTTLSLIHIYSSFIDYKGGTLQGTSEF